MKFDRFPSRVKIVEVGPRDGLQNESQILTVDEKLKFIELLGEAGALNIELASFVRSDRIPQMANADELVKRSLQSLRKKGQYICLVPNQKGFERAIECGVKNIALFVGATEKFNQKNMNSSIDETLNRFQEISVEAKKNEVAIRGYISTVFGCPYEGEPSYENIVKIAKFFYEIGVYEISLGDTIGTGTPQKVINIVGLLQKHIPLSLVGMHFHDTRGLALCNVMTSLDLGISLFDSSAGGLGGCPYASGASGNVATEDLLYLFESLGIRTGIDFDKMRKASAYALEKLNKKSPSRLINSISN